MDKRVFENMIEKLLEKPYIIVDILPVRVPDDVPGNYFAVEEYLLQHPQIDGIFERFARFLLKLNCYYDFTAMMFDDDPPIPGPEPEEVFCAVMACIGSDAGRQLLIYIGSEHTLFVISGDFLHMTVFGATESLAYAAEHIASSEGLYVREPEE
ncbi:MAG: hypothetical protein IJM62_01800 [Lachnospiraceae bacterium]|nr:hypothetical protein [Lachnospiraceae bacterium]